jgi:hypothetical protein
MTPDVARTSRATGKNTGGHMRRAILVALSTGAVISSAAALGIGAASHDPLHSMDRERYEDALRSIDLARMAQLQHCETRANAAEREYCRAEAAATEMVGVAETEEAFRRTEHASRALLRARIDARYQLDRAACAAVFGKQRDRCLIEAHAARGRMMLQAAAPYETKS